MRFFTATFAGVVALASVVLAAENPITQPDGSAPIAAGKPQTITWEPTSEGTITLTLRKGDSKDLKDVTVITADATNSGSYTWTPPKDLPAGENYAIMITDAAGESNYTPLIAIDSKVLAEESSSSASSKTASATATKTSASKTHTTEEATSKTLTTEEATTKTHTKIPKITSYSHGNKTTMATKHRNSTKTSSRSSTKKSSKTTSLDTTETSEPTATDVPTDAPTAAPTDSSAMAIVRSPLALVACMVAALMYLN